MKYIEWPASVSWGPEDEKEYTKDGCNPFDAGVLYCMDKLEEQVKEGEIIDSDADLQLCPDCAERVCNKIEEILLKRLINSQEKHVL